MYRTLCLELKCCNKVIENIEALKLFSKITQEDLNFVHNRTEELINSGDLKDFLFLNSYSLATLLEKLECDLTVLAACEELLTEKCPVFSASDYNDKWKLHVTKEKQDLAEMVDKLDKILEIAHNWKDTLDKEEDAGYSSSYSDYSGSDTSSSEDEEEDDEKS